MSSTAAAMPVATTSKSPKRRSGSRKAKSGPSLSKLILKAAAASTERGGMSLAALKKELKNGGYDVNKNKGRILVAIKRLVANKSLVRTKGSGASGSFKVNKKPTKKKVAKKKRVTAKKVKKTRVKKAGATSPSAKKSPKKKKAKTAKKPKKPKRPSSAKRPKVKTPRRIKRKATKTRTRTRGAAAKK